MSDLERAVEIFSQMQNSEGMKPDEILFNVLLDACINCRQVDRAITLFKQCKGENASMKPDEISFNTIIKGCA